MKNRISLFFCVFFLLFIVGIKDKTAFSSLFGPTAGNTGSPADNGSTCNKGGCHDSFDLNEGDAIFSISAPSTFQLGETLLITVPFENTDTNTHGFQVSALDANDEHVGTFYTTDHLTEIDGDYINHNLFGTYRESWEIEWIAPYSNKVGTVTFYAAGNEANGDDLPTGDFIYTTTLTVPQSPAIITGNGEVEIDTRDRLGGSVPFVKLALNYNNGEYVFNWRTDKYGNTPYFDLEFGLYAITCERRGYITTEVELEHYDYDYEFDITLDESGKEVTTYDETYDWNGDWIGDIFGKIITVNLEKSG